MEILTITKDKLYGYSKIFKIKNYKKPTIEFF